MVTCAVCNGCQTVVCMGTMRAMTSVACFAGTVVGPAGAVLSTPRINAIFGRPGFALHWFLDGLVC